MTQTATDIPTPAPTPSPEADLNEQLLRGALRTDVSPAVAWTMILSFLALLFALPIIQAVAELRSGRPVGVCSLFSVARVPTRADLKQYEDALSEQSLAIRHCQPRVQELLTRWGGFGSTSVVVGRDGFLYYRPGVDSVTAPGFLDQQTLRRRSRNWRDAGLSERVHPDPRPAIIAFHRQLADRGARLVLLPVPDKATLQADRLARHGPSGPCHNLSFPRFLDEMRQQGVDVFDPASLPAGNPDRYLAQDTHWTPQWMDQVAAALARHVQPHLAPVPAERMRLCPAEVSSAGDLTDMLRLTSHQRLFSAQTVTVDRVLDASGQPIRPSADSQVLLLGDSFANIFSSEQMGWGRGAGLPEHLACHLAQRIDWIARNDAGAHATRELLASQLAQGRDRLAGKRVVIWEFAARELALGDWRPMLLRSQ